MFGFGTNKQGLEAYKEFFENKLTFGTCRYAELQPYGKGLFANWDGMSVLLLPSVNDTFVLEISMPPTKWKGSPRINDIKRIAREVITPCAVESLVAEDTNQNYRIMFYTSGTEYPNSFGLLYTPSEFTVSMQIMNLPYNPNPATFGVAVQINMEILKKYGQKLISQGIVG